MDIILREIQINDWITVVILCCLSFIATAKLINSVLFSDFIMLFNTHKYIVLSQRADRLSSLFNVMLVVGQILSVSLFMYICIDVFAIGNIQVDKYFFFKLTAFYTILLVVKILIEKIIGAIFSIDDLVENYLFYKISYRNFFGILLLPFNLLFIYTVKPSQIVLIIMIICLLILNVIVLISVYKKNENIILGNLFYFILYLCALEIAPYFILYKLII